LINYLNKIKQIKGKVIAVMMFRVFFLMSLILGLSACDTGQQKKTDQTVPNDMDDIKIIDKVDAADSPKAKNVVVSTSVVKAEDTLKVKRVVEVADTVKIEKEGKDDLKTVNAIEPNIVVKDSEVIKAKNKVRAANAPKTVDNKVTVDSVSKIEEGDSVNSKDRAHNITNVIGDSLTIITPKGALLEDHLISGNKTYTLTYADHTQRTLTYITQISPQKEHELGLFSYSKTKCDKQMQYSMLNQGEYINHSTHCLMRNGNDFPKHGMVAAFEGTYSVKHGKHTDTHQIGITKTQSIHTIKANIKAETSSLETDYIATEEDFYNLFKRYRDNALVFKFKNFTPEELKVAVSQQVRSLSTQEKSYVSHINGFTTEGIFNSENELTLKGNDFLDGVVTFKFVTKSDKNEGSILTLTPTYYPSSQEVGTGAHKTINFMKQRTKILLMIRHISKNKE